MSESAVTPASDWKARLALVRRSGFWRRVDGLLRAWGPLILLIFAVCYYGQYYRSGLNLGGEGGTVAVNAMRLNEGWLPIKDTTLNYNVMWFYPVAWLFKLTGPDYIALRLYFFALCVVAGLLGFLIVRRITARGWCALGVGLLILLIPGMLFRNYMGLLALLNAWALLHAFVLESTRGKWKWAWFGIAGLVLGLTFLIRIEVGEFFAVIYLGLIALYPLGVCRGFLRRLPIALGGGAVCVAAAVALHIPFYLDAQRRGFDREFVNDYAAKWNLIKYEALKTFSRPQPKATPRPAPAAVVVESGWIPVRFNKTEKNWAQSARAAKAQHDEAGRQGRQRESLRDVFKQPSFYDAVFILILHLPILIGALIFVAAGIALVWAIMTASASVKESALVCLVTLGSALTLFSQYFFFRPDTPHLSEFMVPFLVAMTCASYYALRLAAALRAPIIRICCVGFVALCAGSEGLYFLHSFPKESAGTIAAARKRTYEMTADNGVRVLVKRREQPWLQDLHDTIVRYSNPDEWVVTFPYSPTINFMTNRRSYLKDLYVDNATAGRNFLRDTVAGIERHQPAVIVIDQRDINDTEFSRFQNWAAPTYDYIRSHYVRIPAKFDTNEIYVRPDKIPTQS